jgi:hypothetical protein
VPPPPHADGINTLWAAKQDNRDHPGFTVGDFLSSPLIKILASPCGRSFFSAIVIKITKNIIIKEKTNIDNITVV